MGAPGDGAFVKTITYGLGVDSLRRENARAQHVRTTVQPPSAPVEAGAVGLWIDHRKAVLVFVTPSGVETTLVLSRVDKQPGRFDGIRSTVRFDQQSVPALDSRDRRFAAQLDLYYDAVIACLHGTRAVLAFGPGEARGELRRRLARNKHDHRVFVFEVADKMTGRQIAAKTMDWLEAARVATPSVRRRSGRPER